MAQASLDDVERGSLYRDQQKHQPILGCRQGTGLGYGKPARGAGSPIEPPRRHRRLEHRLEGHEQMRDLVESHAGAIQDVCGAGLPGGTPSTGHPWCLHGKEAP